MRTTGKPGILYNTFGIRFAAFSGRETGDIAFRACRLFAVFLLLVIGNERHTRKFMLL